MQELGAVVLTFAKSARRGRPLNTPALSSQQRRKHEIERLTARLKEAGEAMLNWHLLDDAERDTATNRALEGK